MTDLCLTSSNKENVDPNPGKELEMEKPIVEDEDEDRKGRAIVIYQDAFFLPKSSCPLVTFTTTPADVNFVEKTMVSDTEGTYILSMEGSDTNTRSTKQAGVNDLATVDKKEAGAEGCKLVPSVWNVTGPDTDCWSALDIPALITAIQHIRETGTPSSLRDRYRRGALKLPGLLMSEAECQAILLNHSHLITEMKESVKSWTKDQEIANTEARFEGLNIRGAIEGPSDKGGLRPKLAILEGFLLFPDHASASESTRKSHGINKENQPPPPRNELGTEQELTALVDVAAYQNINAAAKQDLMSHFDIKLFLPTSKTQAKSRRFARRLYIDAPHGDRLPGQMWKTDGYFNEIAWGNYLKESAWLVEADGVESSSEAVNHGVHVRPVMDLGLEDTVRWAVDVILGELGNKVCVPNPTAQCESAFWNEEGDYEDEEGHAGERGHEEGEKLMMKMEKCGNHNICLSIILTQSRNVLREKLRVVRQRLAELVNFNSKTKAAARENKDGTKRDSLVSFFGKVKAKGKANGKETSRDIGLKTVLGSGLVDRGFWSPKP